MQVYYVSIIVIQIRFSRLSLCHFILSICYIQVQIYSSTSLQIHRTISNFKLLALGGSYRDDGKLLVAGGDEGLIRLFDVDGKAILRVFKGHTGYLYSAVSTNLACW